MGEDGDMRIMGYTTPDRRRRGKRIQGYLGKTQEEYSHLFHPKEMQHDYLENSVIVLRDQRMIGAG